MNNPADPIEPPFGASSSPFGKTVIDHDSLAGPPGPPPLAPPMAEPPAAPPPPPARRGGSGGAIFLNLLLSAALAGGIYYTWTHPQSQDSGDALADLQRQAQSSAQAASQATTQAQTLAQQVQTLSDRVDHLEKAAAQAATSAAAAPATAAPAAAPDLGDLPKQVADLSARVDALANRPADGSAPAAPAAPAPDISGLQQSVAELTQKVQQAQAAADQSGQKLDQAIGTETARLDQVQATDTAAKTTLDALGARVTQLEQGAGKVENAADRAARISRVQAAAVALAAGQSLGDIPGAPPALTRFATVAPPTEAALREQFPAVAAHARDVSQPDVAQKSFLQRAFARLQESVTVRQGDDVLVGDPAAGVLTDAETEVQNADLQGAVTTLQRLHGPAAAAVQPWVDQATALLAARAALASMAARG